MTDVYVRVQAILADLLVLRTEDIHPDSLLVDDLDADSISFLELWFLLEKEFDLQLPEVKADEETLSMPLLDGLERLEAMGGQTTLFEFVKHVVDRRMPDGTAAAGTPRLITEAAAAIDRGQRAKLAREHTVATLAALIGARVPSGLSPDTPLTELRLRDFFRFLTVGALAEYVGFVSTAVGPPSRSA